MKRNRINIRVSDELWERITVEAAVHGSTMTAIIETALSQYFDAGHCEGQDSKLFLRMDRYEALQSQIESDLRVCSETLGQFVLYWLIHTRPLDDIDREAAYADGNRRYKNFIARVAQRMSRPT